MSTNVEQNSGPKLIGKIIGGTLDLKDKGLTSLSFIGVQPKLQVLILSNNNLTSFKTLAPQPNLRVIYADHNPLQYIDGLDKQVCLESLDVSETPLTSKSKYRIKILATAKNLNTLNGKDFTAQERQHSKKLMTNYPDQQLISDEEKQSKALQDENKVIQFKMYMSHHRDQLGDFARNEAVLWDLTNNGPLPIVTQYTTDEELKRAIVLLKRRNQKITSTFLK